MQRSIGASSRDLPPVPSFLVAGAPLYCCPQGENDSGTEGVVAAAAAVVVVATADADLEEIGVEGVTGAPGAGAGEADAAAAAIWAAAICAAAAC